MFNQNREIGSEFWDVPTKEKETRAFPASTQWFLSGRSALQTIIRELEDARSVSLPSWCCDSMVKPFIDAGITVHFYPVYWRDGLIQEPSLDSDALFLMDYFGYSAPAPDLGAYQGAVIRDVTHSIFSAAYSDADYYFGSLRKWCGVWTGGYAWTRDAHTLSMDAADGLAYISLRQKAMQLKSDYISGSEVSDKGYLKVFEEAEESLEQAGAFPGAERDIRLARRLNAKLIRERRRENAEVLRAAFAEWLIFPDLLPSDCPMFVPIQVPGGKRDELRRYLIRNEIYCPVHWPASDCLRWNEQTERLCQNELSLVCDQRYGLDDMNRMAETIQRFFKEG